MKMIVFFEPRLNGHRLEYLHHEAVRASLVKTDKFVFIVPHEFNEVKNQFVWPCSPNISFIYISDIEAPQYYQSNPIKCSWCVSKILRKYAKDLRADCIFLNTLMDGMPFLPLMLPKHTKISGILYGIYFWQKDEISKIKQVYNRLVYYLLKYHHSFSKVLLLNDNETATRLNKECHNTRFVCLPDPITKIDNKKIVDIRKEYGISPEKTLYLQFPIAKRKHTIDILRAIEETDTNLLKNKAFLFVGKLDDSIKEEFHKRINKVVQKCQIVVVERRLTYEELFNFCNTTDVLFTLYENHYMSSGVLGYSAYFNKYLISTGKGLLGNLVKSYKLGLCINDITPHKIAEALKVTPSKCISNYARSHTVEAFSDVVFNSFS